MQICFYYKHENLILNDDEKRILHTDIIKLCNVKGFFWLEIICYNLSSGEKEDMIGGEVKRHSIR